MMIHKVSAVLDVIVVRLIGTTWGALELSREWHMIIIEQVKRFCWGNL